MKRLLLTLFIAFFMVAGCGVTVSDYDHAVLDGVSNLNLNKPEKALQDFNRAIEIDPTQAKGFVGRANTLNTLGRYEEAIADYEKGLELDPKIDNPPSFVKRLFSNEPPTDKGIRKYLEFLKQKVKDQNG
jgi:tetratricopeptide (TPR) repeat protein